MAPLREEQELKNIVYSISFFFIGLISLHAESSKPASAKQPLSKVKLALNWVPEPEFGGIYAAKLDKNYEKHGLDVEILPGAAGTPTIQMLAAGQIDFVVTSANELAMARAKGADVVAVFSIYEISPLGIMVHESRGVKTLDEVFQKGILSIQKGQTFFDFLSKKYDLKKVQIVPYAGGVAAFLRDPLFAQQCFVTSEPILARQQGAKTKSFLVADAGYNPYIAVIAVRGETLRKNESLVRSFVRATREGWIKYQADFKATNIHMSTLNKIMDLKTMDEAAIAQRELVQKDKSIPLGNMTTSRWKQIIDRLLEFKVISKALTPEENFKNFD